MRFLVTGADGFVGARICRALEGEGHDVHGVVFPAGRGRRPLPEAVQVHAVDLTDLRSVRSLVETVAPEVCIHAAWYTEPGKYLHAEENLRLLSASVELAGCLADAGLRRFVGVGTCFEYDVTTGYLREDTPCRPGTLYGACKHALHTVLKAFLAGRSVSFAWARLFFLYGPGEAPQRLVPDVTTALLRGVPAEVSEGKQGIDLLHVDDVARALMLLGTSEAEGDFNVCSGTPVAVRDVVATIASLLGQEALVRYGARASRATDPQLICGDASRIEALGFRPTFDLRTGLADAIAAHKQSTAGGRA